MKDSRSVEIRVRPVWSRLEGQAPVRELMDLFAVEDQNSRREPFYCFRADQTFFTGLLPEVVDFLKAEGLEVRVFEERRSPVRTRPWPLEGVALRPYQERVGELLRARSLLLAQLPSAAGKTFCALAAISHLSAERVLYLTDRLDLAFQFRDVARRHLGLDPGMVGGGRCEVDSPLVVASVDSAHSLIDKLGSFSLTIVDEAHTSAAPRQLDLVTRISSPYRLGLSATPFRTRASETVLLRALFGPPVEIETYERLEAARLVARPRLRMVRVEAPPLDLTLPWKRLEEALTENPGRNDRIVEEALALSRQGETVLLLVHLLRHGEILRDGFRSRGEAAPFLSGETPAGERHRVLSEFRQGRGGCLIGTDVLAVGVDLPGLGGLINCTGLWAKLPLLQKIGRILRVSPDRPALTKWVIDFDDSALHPTLGRHSQARRRWMEEVLGLKEEADERAHGSR